MAFSRKWRVGTGGSLLDSSGYALDEILRSEELGRVLHDTMYRQRRYEEEMQRESKKGRGVTGFFSLVLSGRGV